MVDSRLHPQCITNDQCVIAMFIVDKNLVVINSLGC